MCTMVCVRSSTPSFTPRKTSSHRWNVCPLEVLCPATSPTLGLMNLGQVTREPPCQTLHAGVHRTSAHHAGGSKEPGQATKPRTCRKPTPGVPGPGTHLAGGPGDLGQAACAPEDI